MDLTGDQRLPAPRAVVWAALNDPAVLKACIPGCERLDWTGENELGATVALKIGLVRMRFSGTIRLEDVVAPERYVLVGEGRGGLAGFAKGRVAVRLDEEGSGTVLSYRVGADVGGPLSSLGGPLVAAAAGRLVARFFDALAARVAEAARGRDDAADLRT